MLREVAEAATAGLSRELRAADIATAEYLAKADETIGLYLVISYREPGWDIDSHGGSFNLDEPETLIEAIELFVELASLSFTEEVSRWSGEYGSRETWLFVDGNKVFHMIDEDIFFQEKTFAQLESVVNKIEDIKKNWKSKIEEEKRIKLEKEEEKRRKLEIESLLKLMNKYPEISKKQNE